MAKEKTITNRIIDDKVVKRPVLLMSNDEKDIELQNSLLKATGKYNIHCDKFNYSNYYIASKNIVAKVLDNEISIVIGEGLGGFHTLMISNEQAPDDHCTLIAKLVINPIIVPTKQMSELGYSKEEIKTYETMEEYVYRQKYIDVMHTLCVFSKDSKCIAEADEFSKRTAIHTIIVDSVEDFINNSFVDYVDKLVRGKNI